MMGHNQKIICPVFHFHPLFLPKFFHYGEKEKKHHYLVAGIPGQQWFISFWHPRPLVVPNSDFALFLYFICKSTRRYLNRTLIY